MASFRNRRLASSFVERPGVARGKRAAFSLSELLVVVGIIALLISLLLPALGKAREASHIVTCESNLKQLAAGAIEYCQENRGNFPLPVRAIVAPSSVRDYMEYFRWDMYVACFHPDGAPVSPVISSFVTDGIWQCPSNQIVTTPFWGGLTILGYAVDGSEPNAMLHSSYVYLASGYYPLVPTGRNYQSQVRDPSRWPHKYWEGGTALKPLFADQIVYGSLDAPASFYINHRSTPGPTAMTAFIRGFNEAFADGHVEWVISIPATPAGTSAYGMSASVTPGWGGNPTSLTVDTNNSAKDAWTPGAGGRIWY